MFLGSQVSQLREKLAELEARSQQSCSGKGLDRPWWGVWDADLGKLVVMEEQL